MKGQWKLFLTGGAIGALLGGYMVGRMRVNGGRTRMTTPKEARGKNRFAETMAGLAAQAADTMDDLSLRARALKHKIVSDN